MQKLTVCLLSSTVQINISAPVKQWFNNAVLLYTVHRALCFLGEIKLPN